MNTDDFAGVVSAVKADLGSDTNDKYAWQPPDLSKSKTFDHLKSKPEAYRTELARYLYANGAPTGISGEMFRALMRRQLSLQPDEILGWLEQTKKESDADAFGCNHFGSWPCTFFMQQIERHSKKTPLSENNLARLRAMKDWPAFNESSYWGSDMRRVLARISKILTAHTDQSSSVPAYQRLGGDEFGRQLERRQLFLEQNAADHWNAVFNLAGTALGSKPTKKFETGVASIMSSYGKERLRRLLHDFLTAAVDAPITEVRKWPPKIYFSDQNTALVKGLVWMCQGFQDKKTVHLVADLCEKGMKKIPACGIASQAVANACFRYLEATPGADVAARLSRLALMIRQKTIKERIQAAIAAKAERAGLTAAELEERVVPDFGLTDGSKTVAFDNYTLEITLHGPATITQTWRRADGTVQKTKPKCVVEKQALKAKFDLLKKELSDLKKTASGQRNRIDRLFAEDVQWPLSDLHEYYIDHPLVSVLARSMIWDITREDGSFCPVLFLDDGWVDVDGNAESPDNTATARLWHPVDSEVDTVLAWRRRLDDLRILQPTKQAFREVYFLTDAERETATYSNRMAGHIVKQHQMANLMATRGWTFQLMGGFDDGFEDQNARKSFSTSPLRAEYLIHKNWAEENINDMGMMTCVGTDQLRFCDPHDTPVPIEDIPRRMLSETMRDADLFVGVTSIGNDPLWRDQGPLPGMRPYWDSYAFGDLDAFAETRKDVLCALLPRLRISEQAHIDGKYLIVDGKLNTYRIHLGSSNILITPGDRFLCIVPQQRGGLSNVGLPFEGDTRLSIILSKALMLADDDKITDPVILEQMPK